MIVPPGYHLLELDHARVVARADLADSFRATLVDRAGRPTTLYEFASHQPQTRKLVGRGIAYAIPLPGSTVRGVVRHTRHGGFLAALTGDLFLTPTRAPHELNVSLELRRRGVPTAEILGFALYPRRAILQRSDVLSREIPEGHDLADIIAHGPANEREMALEATRHLLEQLAEARARHYDLNAKNVLVAHGVAYLLDVDRVTLGGRRADVRRDNLARLQRSLAKRPGGLSVPA